MRTSLLSALTLTLGAVLTMSSAAQEKIAPPVKVEVSAPPAACTAECLHKTCIAVPTTTKKTKVEYSMQEKDLCLPKCLFGGLFHRGGHSAGHGHTCTDDCPKVGCTQCGQPRTVRVLMKRTVTTECPDTKCEAVLQPAAPRCLPRH
jgi:hypothetical protein